MKNKSVYISLGLMVMSLAISGCSQTGDSAAVPALSDSVMEVEIPEPAPIEEPDPIDKEEIEENIVEDVPLTQEEIDELLATFTTDRAREGVEAYKSIMETGIYTFSSGAVVTNVKGKPGDTSWRQMTDEEAQAALDADPNDLIAYGELHAREYNNHYGQTVYYNPYDYVEAMRQAQEEDREHLLDPRKMMPFELAEPERARELYRESGYTEEEIDKQFKEIEEWYNQKLQESY